MNRRRLIAGGLLGWASSTRAEIVHIVSLATADGSRLELQFGERFDEASRAAARDAVERAATAVLGYFGRFPRRDVEILFVAVDGAGIRGGATFPNPEPYVRLRLGVETRAADLADDWVLVHEMVHLALPRVPRSQNWFHEGAATYVEGVARVGAGQLDAASMWRGLARGLPRGLPRDDDRGLDHTPTWGRTYWGGALFCLLADIDSRRRGARFGLQQGLRGVLGAGGHYGVAWPLERVLDTADAAIGHPVLRELHAQHGSRATMVDLPSLLRELGVDASSAALDETAPLSAIRRAIAG